MDLSLQELLSPSVPNTYLKWEEDQKKELDLYQTAFVYLPLFDHANQQIDKGYVQSGIIEMIIPSPQDALPGEVPPEKTRKVVQHAEAARLPATAVESLRDDYSGGASYLTTPGAGMSQVVGQARHSLHYFARPGVIAGYVESANRKFGGKRLTSIANISPMDFIKSGLNQLLFTVESFDQIRREKVRRLLPRIQSIRVEHFHRIKDEMGAQWAKLIDELLECERLAGIAANDHLNQREEDRKMGNALGTSTRDKVCQVYLGRKWAIETANEVMKDQKAAQQTQQEQLLEIARVNADQTAKLTDAMTKIAEAVSRPQQIVLPEGMTIAPRPAPTAPAQTTEQKKTGR